jgi:hypothetical protein
MPEPIRVLTEAIKKVPSVRYALGVAGVAAAAALIVSMVGTTKSAVIILSCTFIAMILLYVFSLLIASRGNASTIAGLILLYSVIVFFCTFLGFTISAFAGYGPKPWAEFLGINSSTAANSGEQLVAVSDSPPLGECKSDIGLNEPYKSGVSHEVCTSAGPRSRVSVSPETRYKDTKEVVTWIVFAADRTTAIARCYCLR